MSDQYKEALAIVGKIYVRAPVSSNMMTTTVTVILMTPLQMSFGSGSELNHVIMKSLAECVLTSGLRQRQGMHMSQV